MSGGIRLGYQLARMATHGSGHPEFGRLNGVLEGQPPLAVGMQMDWLVSLFSKAFNKRDPWFYAGVDYAGTPLAMDLDKSPLPTALILVKEGVSRRHPIQWTPMSVTFDRKAHKLSSVVVPLYADDAGERLAETIDTIITNFFENAQP